MNKTELRDDYISNGWTVQQIANWVLVSSVEGVVKYDVNVVSPSPNYRFFTAQVVVTDDGGPAETAVPLGQWVDPASSFSQRLRAYLDTVEELASVFAVATTQIYEADAVAICNAYMTDQSIAVYVVSERGGVFDKQLLA